MRAVKSNGKLRVRHRGDNDLSSSEEIPDELFSRRDGRDGYPRLDQRKSAYGNTRVSAAVDTKQMTHSLVCARDATHVTRVRGVYRLHSSVVLDRSRSTIHTRVGRASVCKRGRPR